MSTANLESGQTTLGAAALTVVNQWNVWRSALKMVGDCGVLSHEQCAQLSTIPRPESGFYRRRNKDGGWSPVAIWLHEGAHVAQVDGRQTDPLEISRWCSRHPITKDTYDKVMAGGAWPDVVPEPVTIGDNNPPEDLTPDQVLARDVTALEAQVREWLKSIGGKPTKKAEADLVTNYQNKFLAFEKQAKDSHKAEKEPHLEAGRVVDRKWFPIRDSAEASKKKLDDIGQAFIRAENARLAEEARIANEAAKKAAAEQAALNPEQPPPVVEEVAPQKVMIGTTGGARGERKVDPVVKVEKLSAFVGYLATLPEPPADLVDLAGKLAKRMHKAGATALPGVSVDGKLLVKEAA